MLPGEDTFSYSKTFDTIKAYADSNVKEFYGMNLQEFLQYPHVVCDFILKDSQRRLTAKTSAEANALNELKEMQKIK